MRIPQVLVDNVVSIFIRESQHAASGVLHEYDFRGPKQLLRNDDAA